MWELGIKFSLVLDKVEVRVSFLNRYRLAGNSKFACKARQPPKNVKIHTFLMIKIKFRIMEEDYNFYKY